MCHTVVLQWTVRKTYILSATASVLQWIEYMYDTDARVAIESGCEWRKGWGIQGMRHLQKRVSSGYRSHWEIDSFVCPLTVYQFKPFSLACTWLLTNLYGSQLQWGVGYNEVVTTVTCRSWLQWGRYNSDMCFLSTFRHNEVVNSKVTSCTKLMLTRVGRLKSRLEFGSRSAFTEVCYLFSIVVNIQDDCLCLE